tara:strand:+ start:10 stop:513 length:504 start_codon:yes stop_codon:yes gene_type:complete
MKAFRDTVKFQRGDAGELIVAEFLKRRGWYINATADFSGVNGDKAPKLTGMNAGLVIPDIDASKDGARCWVEVKTKKEPVLFRKTGRLRHGVDTRHFRQYQEVEQITGSKAYVVIYEESTGDLLCAPLARLAKAILRGAGTGWAEQMVFWDRDVFDVLGNVDAEPVQ